MNIALIFFLVWGGFLLLAAALLVGFDIYLTTRREALRQKLEALK